MKYFLIILFFISFSASAQYKAINLNKTIIRYDTTLVNETPETVSSTGWIFLRLKSNDDTLAVIFNDGNLWTKAALVAGSISQIGTTTLIQITLPSTTGNNRFYLNNQIVYHYTVTSHYMTNLFNNDKFKKFIRNSDGKEVAIFHGNGCIWNVMPSTVTLLAQGIVKVIIP